MEPSYTPWRQWFAWHPVRTPRGLRWLCNLERSLGWNRIPSSQSGEFWYIYRDLANRKGGDRWLYGAAILTGAICGSIGLLGFGLSVWEVLALEIPAFIGGLLASRTNG